MQAGSALAMKNAAYASRDTTLPSEIQKNSTQASIPYQIGISRTSPVSQI